jgi:L-serine deaminase
VSVKLKTDCSINKYKKYRNKLTSILRAAEKVYYSELLDYHKSDMKKTWQIINKCIKKGQVKSQFPDTSKVNNK